jgi:hypothetical protein
MRYIIRKKSLARTPSQDLPKSPAGPAAWFSFDEFRRWFPLRCRNIAYRSTDFIGAIIGRSLHPCDSGENGKAGTLAN